MTTKTDELFIEMRKAHEALQKSVDKKIGNMKDDPIYQAEINKSNEAIVALRKEMDDFVAANKRDLPSTKKGDLTPEEQTRNEAFVMLLRHGMGEHGRSIMTPEHVRSLSGSSDADGGFIIPTSFEQDIIKQAFNETELRPLVNAMPTGRDSVYMPALSKPSVSWGTRNLKVTAEELNTGAERIEIFDLKALTLINNNTLDDSDADVWGELQTMFASAIAEAEDEAISVAAGHKMPEGILGSAGVLANETKTGVAAGLTNGSNNGVDKLIEMLHSLNKQYRRRSTWCMNSTTEGKIRQLKDSTGAYLWQPPVQAGAAATLLGRPVANPEAMEDVGAGTIPIFLGDLRSGYQLRDRQGISVQRLVESYAEYDQVGFLLKKRLGGQVTLPEAFRVLKVGA